MKTYLIKFYDKGNNLKYIDKIAFDTYDEFDAYVDSMIKNRNLDVFQDEDSVSIMEL